MALKASIIKKVMATDAFLERKFSENCWTHNLTSLLELAGLTLALAAATAAAPDIGINWTIAKDWKEDRRYHRITETEAKDLYAALADPLHGVLPWIKTHW